MHIRVTDWGDPIQLEMDEEGRRFLRANILEAMQELGEDEYDTRTGFSLQQAKEIKDALKPPPSE